MKPVTEKLNTHRNLPVTEKIASSTKNLLQ